MPHWCLQSVTSCEVTEYSVDVLMLQWDAQCLQGLWRVLYLYLYHIYVTDIDDMDCCSCIGTFLALAFRSFALPKFEG